MAKRLHLLSKGNIIEMALIVDYHIITKVKTLYLKIYTLIAGVSIMLFSNFITDSISGKNDIIWNYYGAGMKVDDTLILRRRSASFRQAK